MSGSCQPKDSDGVKQNNTPKTTTTKKNFLSVRLAVRLCSLPVQTDDRPKTEFSSADPRRIEQVNSIVADLAVLTRSLQFFFFFFFLTPSFWRVVEDLVDTYTCTYTHKHKETQTDDRTNQNRRRRRNKRQVPTTMFRFALLLLVATASSSYTEAKPVFRSAVMDSEEFQLQALAAEFESWAVEHDKGYDSVDETTERMKIWKKNHGASVSGE